MGGLVQGQVIYFVENFKVRHCKYLCVHPTGGGHYHILIDECEEPFRIYKSRLDHILNQGHVDYKSAALALAQKLEDVAKSYRSRL